MRRHWALVLVVLLSVSCSDEAAFQLAIDLRTDYLSGADFTTIEASVDVGGAVRPAIPVSALAGDPYDVGTRIAEYDALPGGEAVIEVVLSDAAGSVVASRRVTLDLSSDAGVTVVISRICATVDCPGPNLTECLNGVCVSPSCQPGAPQGCGDATCAAATPCDSPAMCVEATCDGFLCLNTPRDEVCEDDEICDPTSGCIGPPDPAWTVDRVVVFGSPGIDDFLRGMALDPMNVPYVVGGFEQEAAFGSMRVTSAGADDGFVAKLGSSDDVDFEWVRTYGEPFRDRLLAVTTDDLGVYVGGNYAGAAVAIGSLDPLPRTDGTDALVVSYGFDGTPRWATTLGGEGATQVQSIAVAGSVIRLGGSHGTTLEIDGVEVALGTGEGFDTFVASFDAADGSFVPDSHEVFGSGPSEFENDQVLAIAPHHVRANVFFAAGYHGGAMPAAGTTEGAYVGAYDAFLAEFDAAGVGVTFSYFWTVGGPSYDAFNGLVVDAGLVCVGGPGNALAIAGDAAPDEELGIVSCRSLGEPAASPVWSAWLNGSVSAIAARGGHLYATGTFQAELQLCTTCDVVTVEDGRDAFVAVWNIADGSYVGGMTFQGGGDEAPRQIAVGSDGSIWIAGTFTEELGLMGLGDGATSSDNFVARLSLTE